LRRIFAISFLFLVVNMKLRLRHKGKTVSLELESETPLNILKFQAQECFNIVLVLCCIGM